MNLMMIGDVVGSTGCKFLRAHLPAFKKLKQIDVVVANGENSADGNGITPASADYLFKSGVDVITAGNHTFRRKECYELFDTCETLLRPANFPPSVPGRGLCILDLGRLQVAVINLMGAVGGMLMLLTMMIFPVTGDTPRYSAVFLVLGLVMAVCVAVLFWQIREPACVAEREAADRAAGSSDEDEGVTDAGGKMPRPMFRSLLFILASVFFWFFGYNAVTSAFSRYAEQELQGNFALVLMICTVAAIVSYMPVGMIAQRIGRKRTILIGIVMLGTAFFAGIFFHSVSPLLYIFFALAGMGWAFINVNSYPMVVELSKGSDVGKYTGYYYTVSMTAQIFTPILSNILMEHVGYRTLFPYAAFFVFASFVTMLFVRHGDARPVAKKGLEALDVDD